MHDKAPASGTGSFPTRTVRDPRHRALAARTQKYITAVCKAESITK
jgi:hypothetical protein